MTKVRTGNLHLPYPLGNSTPLHYDPPTPTSSDDETDLPRRFDVMIAVPSKRRRPRKDAGRPALKIQRTQILEVQRTQIPEVAKEVAFTVGEQFAAWARARAFQLWVRFCCEAVRAIEERRDMEGLWVEVDRVDIEAASLDVEMEDVNAPSLPPAPTMTPLLPDFLIPSQPPSPFPPNTPLPYQETAHESQWRDYYESLQQELDQYSPRASISTAFSSTFDFDAETRSFLDSYAEYQRDTQVSGERERAVNERLRAIYASETVNVPADNSPQALPSIFQSRRRESWDSLYHISVASSVCSDEVVSTENPSITSPPVLQLLSPPRPSSASTTWNFTENEHDSVEYRPQYPPTATPTRWGEGTEYEMSGAMPSDAMRTPFHPWPISAAEYAAQSTEFQRRSSEQGGRGGYRAPYYEDIDEEEV